MPHQVSEVDEYFLEKLIRVMLHRTLPFEKKNVIIRYVNGILFSILSA